VDSKSFRIINRIDAYMRDKNLVYTYSDFFGKEKLEVTQKKEKKRILK
jgi:hypothetical protein